MPRKVDSCMFCMMGECEEHTQKAPAKKSKPKSKPAPVEKGKTVDLKEAMKKAVRKEGPTPTSAVHIHVKGESNPQVEDETDHELAAALLVLEPILHPDEKARFALVLDNLGTRAERWKMRRQTE